MSFEWSHLEFFDKSEFGPHADKMSEDLLTRLDMIRRDAGVPMYITSSYREGDDKAHGKGYAVDVSDNVHGDEVSSRWRMLVVSAALEAGIRRCGVYDRHIHLDVWPEGPQDVMWWSKSS